MSNLDTRPAFYRSVIRLACSACGAEANASCSCGKPYVPAAQRVAEYDRTNPGQSTRKAAADLGVSKSEVSRSRQGVPRGTGEAITGRDGKIYPIRLAPRSRRSRQAHIDRALALIKPLNTEEAFAVIVELFGQLDREAQTRCLLKLRNVMQGRR